MADCGPIPPWGSGLAWECEVCATNYPYPLLHRCPGAKDAPAIAAAPIYDCPAIAAPCNELRINVMNFFCRLDLAGIEGPCSDMKRAEAVAVLLARLEGRAPPCPRQ